LALKWQRDALIGCDVHQPEVRLEVADVGLTEEHERDLLELDRDLSVSRRHALAGAHVERNAGPTPVINAQLERDESSVFESGATSGSRDRQGPHAFDLAFAVLIRARCNAERFRQSGWIAFRILACSSRTGVGVERIRRSMAVEAHQLADVIRDHVAERSGMLEVSAALFHATSRPR